MNGGRNKINRRGAALLVVLFVVMAVTVLSLGFLSRSDVELACGKNMILRTKMDYLAESALEHARGLILNPQDVNSEYWTGAVGQQLVAGSDDYYDITVVCDDSVPTNRCDYIIDCNSYRLKAGEKVGRTSLEAELRLDPCIAFWAERDTTIWQRITIAGDVGCNGVLTNNGAIDGDVFANGFSGNKPLGQQKPLADLSLQWPPVTVEDFTLRYTVKSIGSTLFGVTYGLYNPVRVCYNGGGDVELNGNVQIYGMLVVDANLTISGGGNVITAGKNLPALLVTGDLKVENDGCLDIDGLAIVEGRVQISAGPANLKIIGGLFTKNGIVETTADSSGNGNTAVVHDNPTWQPFGGGQIKGALEFDGVNDYLWVGNSSSLQLSSALTIAAWIKGDGWGTGSDVDTIARKGEVNPVNYQLAIADGKVSLMLDDIDSGGGLRGNTLLSTVQWYHVAAAWDGSTVRIYVNGILDNDPPESRAGTIGTDMRPLYIGGRDGADFFDGIIDDVRIYNRALDPNEVYPPIDGLAGLVGHWELDENGSSNVSITAAPSKTAIVVWPGGVAEKWGSAAGAFFRSIRRK